MRLLAFRRRLFSRFIGRRADIIMTYFCIDEVVYENVITKISTDFNFQFILIKSGCCYIYLSEKKICCGINDLVLLKPHSSVNISQEKSSVPLIIYHVKICPNTLCDISDENTDLLSFFEYLFPQKILITKPDNSLVMIVKNLLQEMIRQKNNPEFGDAIYQNSLRNVIVILLARAYISNSEQNRSNNPLVDSIFSYINAHITEDITMAELAETFNVSERHISRVVKSAAQQSVHDYIIQKKISNCMKYIVEGRSIKEVYVLAGFGSYNHFFRAFKKVLNMTPKEYFKIISQDKANHSNKDNVIHY